MLKYCTLRKLDKNRSIEFYGVGGLGQIAHASKQHGYKIILWLRKFDYNDKTDAKTFDENKIAEATNIGINHTNDRFHRYIK